MDVKKYKLKIKNEVVAPLKEYLKECGKDAGYNIFHVLKCKNLLARYLNALNKISPILDESILKEVKKVVLALNALNEKTQYCLIETDARESIWEVIQNSAVERGLKNAEEDITEEWREW